jgi:hypothetical protein
MIFETNFRPSRSRVFGAAALLGLLLVGIGCASKEFSYATTVSGGEQLRFTFSAGRPAPVRADGYQILDAGIRPEGAEKKVVCGFMFLDENVNRPLKSVKVEDVTEEKPILLLEDLAPKLENKRWVAVTKPYTAESPEIKWVFYIADSVLVYRFTITSADGRTVVLHQAAMVPAWVKGLIRAMFGEKY